MGGGRIQRRWTAMLRDHIDMRRATRSAFTERSGIVTNRADYTDQQWQLLLDVPPAVGTAVMVAGRSGLGSVKEAIAMANQILGARHGYEGVELVESLVEARLQHGEKSTIETLGSPYRGKRPEDVCEDAVAKCQDVAELLAPKATASEVNGYKQWTIRVAEKVADAAVEGGILGFGGQRVSDEERQVLKAVKLALRA